MKIFRHKFVKVISMFLAINIMYQCLFPTIALALTTGPTQPEVQGFQPIGVTDMVDPFSGDFSYNIPLVDVGGYPLNLSYSSSVSMDQEASWVGLGWTLSPGSVNRTVRGVPDDFDGDIVKRKNDMKPQTAFGVGGNVALELFGYNGLSLGVSLGLGFSNYDGYNFDFGITPSYSSTKYCGGTGTVSLGISGSSGGGGELSPNFSFSKKSEDETKKDGYGFSLGGTYSSREGFKSLTLSGNLGSKSKVPESFKKANADISFATPIYMIKPNAQSTNLSISFNASFGAEVFGTNPDFAINGYASSQIIDNSTRDYNAYGYLYEQNSSSKDILDFNREKEVSFSKECPYLPVTNHSYDVYAVTGQGIAGSYRPFRNDIGIIHDPSSICLAGASANLGIELGVGNAAHSGASITINANISQSGLWDIGNFALKSIPFRDHKNASLNENVYFKQAGEKTSDKEPQKFTAIGGESPISMKINTVYGTPLNSASPVFYSNSGSKIDYDNLSTSNKKEREQRVSRNQNIEMLTAEKAKDFALIKNIESYSVNTFNYSANGYKDKTSYNRLDPTNGKRPRHISEITTTKSDGSRYIFGIPAYNNDQNEQSFTVDGTGNKANKKRGLVAFDGTYDIENTDKYFDQTITPPFAHSYLLTSVLSVDYEDVAQDGPTPDDLGSYTKINYSKVYSDYRWRTPYDSANYAENFKSQVTDDKGNFVFGKKEVWYVHSIETKTHIAEFYISKRNDALGVTGISGGKDVSQCLYKLDSIKLYNREDKLANEASAVPVKVVHFEYDYSLCPGIPNSSNGGGKLTLKKVYFTYAGSFKGKFSPYEFTYSSHNYPYNFKDYDRWGNYKPNDVNLPNTDFPYTDQDSSKANQYSDAWCLKKIKIPSGGTINVNYEADNYAFVQDKPAMQMFKIIGSGQSSSYTTVSNELYDNNFIYFNLDPAVKNDITFYKRNLLDGNNKMYFKFFMFLGNNAGTNYNEYVPGYVDIDDIGLCGDGVHGYIKLSTTGTEYKQHSGSENPISKAGWTFIRANLPRMVSGQGSPDDSKNAVSMIKSILATFRGIFQLFSGVNTNLKQRGFCETFDITKSWVRLYNPTGFKYGGGSRVKNVKISDEWNTLSNGQTSEYGQEYSYTTTDENNRTISSGVAAYEPIPGGEENPFRQPVMLKHKANAPGQPDFLETPFGETYFPSPSVGYSRVSVKNISPSNVKRHATGYTVNEFYTAKDFPTKVENTNADYLRNKPIIPFSIFRYNTVDYMVASQGYSIVLNDMHGKPKSTLVYPENKTQAISTIRYYYQQTQSGDRLNNDAYVLNKENIDGAISKKPIGVDYDIVSDMRCSQSMMINAGASVNLDAFVAGIIPGVFPTIYPSFSSQELGFNSVVMTKVINKYGILIRTEATDLGSSITTNNLLYDGETGETILTETINQFNDHVYNFTYPAHWAYTQMEPSYINTGVEIKNATIDANKQFFVVGDELGVISKGSALRLWVNDVTPNSITVIDKDGNSSIGSQTYSSQAYSSITILRSGRRNMQTTPIGTVSCMTNPLIDVNKDGVYDKIDLKSFTNVINASAIEFGSKWRLYCTCNTDFSDPSVLYNPFLVGAKGKMKPLKTYAYLTERTQTNDNGHTNIRKDGIFANYNPFWMPPQTAGSNWINDTTNWQYTTEVTQFDPHGFEVENKDPLNRYNSALYGYRNTQAVAVANNATLRNVGYDGFEDYLDATECVDDHFSFRIGRTAVKSVVAHTGKYSIEVKAKDSVVLRKVIKKNH